MHRKQRGKEVLPHAPPTPHLLTWRRQFIGGYKGDWRDVPSGQNCEKKLKILAEEGVHFDDQGMLVDKSRWWQDFKA